jgi:hypothetical protein
MNIANIPIISHALEFFLSDKDNQKKLNIELVPHTMHYKNVRAVLSQEAWKALCTITHRENLLHCCECGAKGRLECHEQWEYVLPGSRPRMRMTKMLSLCHLCHMGKHIKFAERNGELPAVKRHLKRVYKLSSLQLWWKICKAVALVRSQSRYEYDLDLTYLNQPKYAVVRNMLGRSFSNKENKYCKDKALQ